MAAASGRIIRTGGQVLRALGRLVGNCTCCGCIPPGCKTLRVTIDGDALAGHPEWSGTWDVHWVKGCGCAASWESDEVDEIGTPTTAVYEGVDVGWRIDRPTFGSLGNPDDETNNCFDFYPWQVPWGPAVTVECLGEIGI